MNRVILSAVHIWQRFTFTRYLAASVIALAADTAVFLTVQMMGLYAGIAGAIGYSVGIIIHWLISANIVFVGRTKTGSPAYIQQTLFAGSAILGLVITLTTISVLSNMGFAPIFAKLVAVGLSFFAVFAVREFGVFK